MAQAKPVSILFLSVVILGSCNRKMSTEEFSNNFSNKTGTKNNTNTGAAGDGESQSSATTSSEASSEASTTSGSSTSGGGTATGGTSTTGGSSTVGGTTTTGGSLTTGGTDTTTGGTDTTTGGTDTTGGTVTTGGDTTGGTTLPPLMCADGVTPATFPGYSAGSGQCAAHCYLPNDMYNNWFVDPAYCGSEDQIDIPCGAQPGSGGEWSVYYMVTRENICSPRYVGCGHETQGPAVDMCNCNGTCPGAIVSDPDADLDGHFDPVDSHPYNAALWDDWNYNDVNDSEEGTAEGTAIGGVSGGAYELSATCSGSGPFIISGTCNHPGEKVSYSFVNENPSLESTYPSVICGEDGTFTGLVAPWVSAWGVDHGPYRDPGLARVTVYCP